ncbi:MAG: efflux transporter outer membrane subunit [Halothiobacillus sp.]
MRDFLPQRDFAIQPKLIVAVPLCAALLGLTGCAAVGPNFVSPAAPKSPQYTIQPLPENTQATPNVAQGSAQKFVTQSQPDSAWWTRLGSAELTALINHGLAASPTLTAAEAKLRQAEKTFVAQAGSSQLPQVNAKLGAQRQGINSSNFGQTGGEKNFNLYNAGLTVSYNLDLFGENRRALEALAAQTDYQQYQLQAARLTLAGNIAIQAITQALLNEQINATQYIIKNQNQQLELIKARLNLGAATRSDVLILQSQMDQTRATLPPLKLKRAYTNHLLATLTGQMPGSAQIPTFNLDTLTLPAQLPVVVPSEWVRARPDIQAASALLHVATAQYGVAVANLYPQINLSATLGSQAITPANLFNAGSVIWSLIGGLTQPVFNGGLKAASEAAHAAVSAAAANYQQVVLDGLRNVADTLQASALDADTLHAQVAAQESAQQSLRMVDQQLKLGAANSLQLLTAQQQVTQSRLLTLTARAQRLVDSVALYQAMGSEDLHSEKIDRPQKPEVVAQSASSTHPLINTQPE